MKRITSKTVIHEVFHFFTHFDKGFPYTLKKLLTAPGKMQREYIEGKRTNHQKPFSMFFICASFSALLIYWVNLALQNYFNAGDSLEAQFFNKYWVLLQIMLLPVYTLITWLFFKRAGFNYAEIGVFQLYVFSIIVLTVASIHLLKFIWPHLQTRYIELPAIIVYTIVTNFNFFIKLSRWEALLKGILSIGISFFLASFTQDLLIKLFSNE